MFIIYSISLSSHTKFLFYVYFMLTVAPGGNNLATICYKDFLGLATINMYYYYYYYYYDYWKNIKILGSYIETRRDITNRKILCINAAEQLTHIFKNNNISLNTKLKIFNTYCSTIFLYNSELWSLNKETTNEVDAFQRRMLRRYVICKQYIPTNY